MNKYKSKRGCVVQRLVSTRRSNKVKSRSVSIDTKQSSSSNNQLVRLFSVQDRSLENSLSSFATSRNPLPLKNFKAWLILTEIRHTIVALTVLIISIYLLMMEHKLLSTSATTDQSQLNQTNLSLTTIQPYTCSGVSPFTSWKLFLTIGITMDINTSSCSFNSTPLYFTSLSGLGNHWNIGGYGAIYNPRKNSFTIYTQPLTFYSSTIMLNYSQMYS